MQTIADYEIVDALGQGGMGVVWRARHRGTGQEVALKMVVAPAEGALAGLRREIRALSMIDHPGVVRVLAEGVVDGQPWYAMELLAGTAMRARLDNVWGSVSSHGQTANLLAPRATPMRSAPLNPGHGALELLPPMLDLCDALAHVHAAGLVHRDLTPENIFLRDDGRAVLVDFGLASQVSRGTGRDVVAVAGAAVGTAPYMAPEQIRGEIVDARADLYALGCILYEIATGRPPFLAASVAGLLSQHLFDAPVIPSQRSRAVPGWLDELLLGLLEKEPRDRIGSAADVHHALAEGLGLHATASAAQPIYRPRLAGRDEALRALEPLLAQGGARVVIEGPSGVGKTRLVVELAQRAAADGVRVIAGECVPLAADGQEQRAAGPLHPLRPLLQAAADRCRERGEDETRRLLGEHGALLGAFEPALTRLPGLAAIEEASPQTTRDRVLAALRHLVVELSRSRPLLLVLDDLQWADELTLRFLASMRAPRVSIFATLRDDEPAPADLDGWQAVTLAGLDESAVRSIAGDMLGAATPPAALTDVLVDLCEGVPFFVAEYLRCAVDDGILTRPAGGAWRLARPPSELPRSPADLLMRRLDRLGDDARAVAAAAAVLGRTLDADLLPAIVGRDDEAVAIAVRDLLRQQVLEEAERGLLRFRHDKLREAAYARLPPARRRAAHREAARALEAKTGSGPGVWPVLAHHWSEADEPARAIDFLERAADHALAVGAYKDTIEFLSRALRHAAHDATIPDLVARRARWHRRLAEAAWCQGDLDQLGRHATVALDAMGHAPPSTPRGWLRVLARESVRRVFPGRPADDDAEAALALSRLAHRHFHAGETLATLAATIWGENLAERSRRPDALAAVGGGYAYLLGSLGLARRAGDAFARARDAAAAIVDPGAEGVLAYQEAAWHIGRARWPDADAALDRALALLRRAGNVHELEVTQSIVAHAAHSLGRYREAEAACRAFLESARARASGMHEAWGLYTVGRERWAQGALDESAVLLDEAGARLERDDCKDDRASVLFVAALAARTAIARGREPEARKHIDHALAVESGGVPQVFTLGHAYAALAEAAASLDDPRLLTPAARALGRYALMFPVGRPSALLAAAHLARLRKLPRVAKSLARRALALATATSQPHEAQLAAAF